MWKKPEIEAPEWESVWKLGDLLNWSFYTCSNSQCCSQISRITMLFDPQIHNCGTIQTKSLFWHISPLAVILSHNSSTLVYIYYMYPGPKEIVRPLHKEPGTWGGARLLKIDISLLVCNYYNRIVWMMEIQTESIYLRCGKNFQYWRYASCTVQQRLSLAARKWKK